MPPVDRSALRNTYIYGSKNRTAVLGGLWVTNSVTNADLYSILEIFCSISSSYSLNDDSEHVVGRNGQQLQPGNYYIGLESLVSKPTARLAQTEWER
ncbi:hypothetical protein HOY80DRAFT_129340 [Tuber brumale]|nr:hypothetical protein HOY80DRAFT_129340 [Tuber brumale]